MYKRTYKQASVCPIHGTKKKYCCRDRNKNIDFYLKSYILK